jgi:hypothetical protein
MDAVINAGRAKHVPISLKLNKCLIKAVKGCVDS